MSNKGKVAIAVAAIVAVAVAVVAIVKKVTGNDNVITPDVTE